MLSSSVVSVLGRWFIIGLVLWLIASFVSAVIGPLLPIVALIWIVGRFAPSKTKN